MARHDPGGNIAKRKLQKLPVRLLELPLGDVCIDSVPRLTTSNTDLAPAACDGRA